MLQIVREILVDVITLLQNEVDAIDGGYATAFSIINCVSNAIKHLAIVIHSVNLL